MKKIEDLNAYEIIEKRKIEDIGSMSCLLRHKKTGARIALLSNDDNNNNVNDNEIYIDDTDDDEAFWNEVFGY